MIASLLLLPGCAPDPTALPAPAAEPATTAPAPKPTAPSPSAEAATPGAPTAPTVGPGSPAPGSPAPGPTGAGASEQPRPEAVIGLDATGDDVRDLQHRLWQLEWYSGRITPDYSEATRLAVEGFQAKRGLPVLGYVDQATWDRLVAMTRTPTRDEMYNILVPGPRLMGRGDEGDQVKDLQARLRQIAWYEADVDGIFGARTVEAVRGFQQKREIPVTGDVDQRTLDRLRKMTHEPTTDELNNVVAPTGPKAMTLDDRCLAGRVVCISKAQRRLAWVVDGQIRRTMDVRFGSELTPTRNGVFSVYWKSRDHVSSLYKTPMPYALFFSGGQAVHYSSDFARRGYNGASHGCVNVRDKKAVAQLFDDVTTGDTVVVY